MMMLSRWQTPLFQVASHVRKANQIHPGISPNLILAGGTGPYGASLDLLKWCSSTFKATYVLLDQDADAQVFKMPPNVYAINNTYHYLADTGYILTDNLKNDDATIYVTQTPKVITHVPRDKVFVTGIGAGTWTYTNGSQIVANQFGAPGFTANRLFFM
jgi:hypothetical protein